MLIASRFSRVAALERLFVNREQVLADFAGELAHADAGPRPPPTPLDWSVVYMDSTLHIKPRYDHRPALAAQSRQTAASLRGTSQVLRAAAAA